MEETIWIGEGRASDESNWSNGLPNGNVKAIIPEDSKPGIWDIDSFSVDVEMEGAGWEVSIDSNCYFGGECYAPRGIVDYTLSFSLDRPPPDLNDYGKVIHFTLENYTNIDVDNDFIDCHYNDDHNLIINIKDGGHNPYEMKDNKIWIGDMHYSGPEFLTKWNELFPQGMMGAASFTSKATGDWDATGQTTWNEVGFPATGDTAQINSTHVIRIDSGTGNEACLSIDLLSGGSLVIDSESSGALSLTFDDAVGAGFSATTADVLTTIGTAGNIVTITSAGAPPTNYWYGPRETDGAGYDMAYTTINYFRSFTARGAIAKAVNVDFLNSSVFGQALRIRDASVTSEFTNVTITGTVTWGIYITGANPSLFTNLDLSGGNFTQEFRFGWSGEFVNCSFDITSIGWLGSNNRKFISKDHNEVSGAYGIVMDDTTATLDKSTITNDYGTGDSVTIYEGILNVDESSACFDLDVKAGGEFKIDAVGATASITHTFDDTASCGFITASTGTLTCVGDVTYGVTLTGGGAPPTNYWNAWTDLDCTMDYTTIEYYGSGSNGFGSDESFDIDNTTFQYSDATGTGVRLHLSTITSFTNVTIDNMAVAVNAFSAPAYTGFDNIVITNPANAYVYTNAKAEFVNSNFDISKVSLGASGVVISDVHNDVGNAWYYWATSTGINKSTITNDFTSSDNVTIYVGKLTCDEAIAHTDLTVRGGGATFDVNQNITHTITATTGRITVESGGILNWNGTSGNTISLVSSSEGTQWEIDLQSTGTINASWCLVRDSDATPGLEVDGTDNCTDVDNNDNWDFGVITVKDTISGNARILGTIKDTISGLGRIKGLNIKDTLSGAARILEVIGDTISGVARIKGLNIKDTISGLARIKQTDIKDTMSGLARILEVVRDTIGGNARVLGAIKDIMSGNSRILGEVKNTISGLARVKGLNIKDTISGFANIVIAGVVKSTISGVARIKAEIKDTIGGQSTIVIQVKDTISGSSRVLEVIRDTIGGLARIKGIIRDTISGSSRIKAINIKDIISGLARVKATDIKNTTSGLARIKQVSIKDTISGDARILEVIKDTISGFASIISLEIKSTINGLARIKGLNIKNTISGIAKIVLFTVNKNTVSGYAYIIVDITGDFEFNTAVDGNIYMEAI